MRDLISVHEYNEGILIEDTDLTYNALRTIHPPLKNCFTLNFISEGNKICFFGDTAYLPSLAKFSEGAKILVHEAMLQKVINYITAKSSNTDDRLYKHFVGSHTFARDVGRIEMMQV